MATRTMRRRALPRRTLRAGAAALALTILGTVAAPSGASSPPAAPRPAAQAPVAGYTPPEAEFAAAAVRDLLGREALPTEVDEMSQALRSGTTRTQVATSLAFSEEAAAALVDQLYQQLLQRSADATGHDFWTGRLTGRGRVRDVAVSLLGSAELQQWTGGTSEGFVDAVYQRVLGRGADASGRAYWIDRLDAGTPRRTVGRAVFTSPESNARRVGLLYQALLRRPADAAGRTFWAGRLATIDDRTVAAGLVASHEYLAAARTSPPPASEWAVEPPEAHGMDAAVLDGARSYAFVPQRNTQGVVVVRHGVIVAEWYADGAAADSWAASWSVGKSITSALVGIAIEEGHIPDVDVPMTTYYPQWAGTAREGTTLRDVLTMTSGLRWQESYSVDDAATSDIIQMVATQRDQLAYAASRPQEVPAGTRFSYSSGDTMLLSGVLEQATGVPVREYAQEKLFGPMGMDQAEMWTDAEGNTLTYCCVDTTSRGFARFGQVYLQGGEWGGHQVVPEDWVEESLAPSPTYDGYGYQWWLTPASGDRPARFSARGHDGQYIYVIPSLDLVVVRNGTYVKDPGPPVGDPNLFVRYPSDGLIPGKGTIGPQGWSDDTFLAPIIASVTDG